MISCTIKIPTLGIEADFDKVEIALNFIKSSADKDRKEFIQSAISKAAQKNEPIIILLNSDELVIIPDPAFRGITPNPSNNQTFGG